MQESWLGKILNHTECCWFSLCDSYVAILYLSSCVETVASAFVETSWAGLLFFLYKWLHHKMDAQMLKGQEIWTAGWFIL